MIVQTCVEPGRLRRLHDESMVVIALYAGYYWFGASGLALIILWLAALGHNRVYSSLHAPAEIDTDRIRSIRMGQLRLWMKFCGGETLAVYRDEVTPAQWSRLRREIHLSQLAMGRNTSRES